MRMISGGLTTLKLGIQNYSPHNKGHFSQNVKVKTDAFGAFSNISYRCTGQDIWERWRLVIFIPTPMFLIVG